MNEEPHPSEILVIDDEKQMRRLLRYTLERAGYRVREATNGSEGLLEAAHHHPDLIILDLGLPDTSGLQVLQRLREWTSTPVVILSVQSAEDEKVTALDSGADDYITKPFGGCELLARLRVLQRRNKPAEEPKVVRFGAIEVDCVYRRVRKAGSPVKLTAREYGILQLLVANSDRVLTHRQILREVWGPQAEQKTHYLHVFMLRLRQKLEDDADAPKYLQTELGVGYRLAIDSA
jgi:two-component system KDP operon response regulator KdpE